jgi:hypothetical protein
VKAENIYEDELSKEDIKLIEERWTDYIKNPSKVKTWNEVKHELRFSF